MKEVILACIIVVLLLSGCTQDSAVTSFARSLPEVQAFLDENPDAAIRAVFISKQNASALIGEIRKECGEQFPEDAYWHVYVTKGSQQVDIYLDGTGQQALCIIKPAVDEEILKELESEEPEEEPESEQQDKCSSSSDCDDSDACTADSCSGTPKECTHEEITACEDNDGCCPSGCSHDEDDDCPEEDECRTHNDCADGDNKTLDRCTGTPKSCTHTLKTCSQMGGEVCSGPTRCDDDLIEAADTNQCCVPRCVSDVSGTYEPEYTPID